MHQQPYAPQQHPPHQHGPMPGGPGYGPGQMGAPNTKDLDDQSLIWLIVAAAGFFFGLGWVTGPLGWIFGARLRNQYRVRGREPEGTATAAWIIGIVSTALYGLVMLMLLGMLAMAFLFVGAAAASGI